MRATRDGRDRGGPGVGLVLSGGAARGMAHLGVLGVLAERSIPIDRIVAASYGSIVAGYYAYGYSPGHLVGMLEEFRASSILNYSRPWRSLYSGEKLTALLEKDLGDARIEELGVPLSILALDLTEMRPVLFERGPLCRAIRASVALPGLLPPLEVEGHVYVDGGMLRGFLLRAARASGADIVVFSDVSVAAALARLGPANALIRFAAGAARRGREPKAPSSRATAAGLYRRTIRIALRDRSAEAAPADLRGAADFTLSPVRGEVGPLRFRDVRTAVELGRRAVLAVLDDLEKRIGTVGRA